MKHIEMLSLEARRLLAANLVADVNGIYPTDTVTVNGVSYFAASDTTHGTELWRSDGTHGGTRMVKDLLAGSSSGNPTYLAAVGNKVVFFSRHGTNLEVWSSDGTDAGTSRLAIVSQINLDVAPIVFQGKVFFVTGLVLSETLKLWSTDGTAAGTKMLATLGEGYTNGGQLTVLGNRLVINVASRLWSTDGSAAGTVGLSSVNSPTMMNSASSVSFVNGKGIVIGSREDDVEMWETDGTLAGSHLIRTFTNSGLSGFTAISGNLAAFIRYDVATDTSRIVTTDGTAAGTGEVLTARRIDSLTALDGGRFAFVAEDNSSATHLWATDGTIAGTTELKAFGVVTGQRGVGFVDVAGTKFFVINNGADISQLWRTDGTVAGTAQVDDLAARGAVNVIAVLTNVDNKLAVTFLGQTLVFDPATMGAPVGPAMNKITITDQVMRIFGTRDADTIRVYQHPTIPSRFVVNINGTSYTFARASVRKMIIYSYAGNDTVELYERYGAIAIRSAIWTGDGNDTITGSSYPDSIYGEGGDDSISGGSGNDLLSGGFGADSIYGGAGQDLISGGADSAHDRLDGGSGQDVIFGTAVLDVFYNGQSAQQDPLDEVLLG